MAVTDERSPMTIFKRMFYREAPPLPKAPAPQEQTTDPVWVRKFFAATPTPSLEVAYKAIGDILEERSKGA
jgi:hypothetical protein